MIKFLKLNDLKLRKLCNALDTVGEPIYKKWKPVRKSISNMKWMKQEELENLTKMVGHDLQTS